MRIKYAQIVRKIFVRILCKNCEHKKFAQKCHQKYAQFCAKMSQHTSAQKCNQNISAQCALNMHKNSAQKTCAHSICVKY